MLRIAAVDDNAEDRRILAEYIERYKTDGGLDAETTMYQSAVDFLEEYRGDCDILLLDIEMPGTDGMSAAREIRKKDDRVAILFITNMARYAINGYEVDACDFILKPVSYNALCDKLSRAAEWADKRRGHHILLSDAESTARVRTTHILWVEKDRNYLIWHTKDGIFREKGSIAGAAERLSAAGVSDSFAICHTGYLVNLEYVEKIDHDTLLISDTTLPVSRRLRKDFLRAYSVWG